MYVRVVSISLLTLFVGCEWWGQASGGIKKIVKETQREAPVVTAQRAAAEVSKATGQSVDEVKSLSKDELSKLAVEAKESSEETLKSADEHNNKKKSEFIDEIKESADKFGVAFKSLVAAGYSGNEASIVVDKVNTAVKKLELGGKLEKILENKGGNTIEDIRKDVNKYGYAAGSCMSNIEDKKQRNDKASDKAPEEGLKDCIKNLMDNVDDLFSDSRGGGICNELRDAAPNAPDKFKDALNKLQKAAWDISQAARKVQFRQWKS
ncbi:hypothetical protein [Borrelia sp. RT5S]|uniref:hypothetical protein n=1 Tax=Borrelia sp. RT5S TaxID=2898581 RepID=UPI001E504FF7|nr:hypothetical protein [Borrelia sp. RT5S]UGQ16738.1 hypothetical protein LSO06_05305 [Borrelia sp. RT5S]